MLSFLRVGSLFGNKLVVTTENGACVFPFTGPTVLGETMEVLVSCTVSSDVDWTAVVVNVPLSASRVLVSEEGMKVG